MGRYSSLYEAGETSSQKLLAQDNDFAEALNETIREAAKKAAQTRFDELNRQMQTEHAALDQANADIIAQTEIKAAAQQAILDLYEQRAAETAKLEDMKAQAESGAVTEKDIEAQQAKVDGFADLIAAEEEKAAVADDAIMAARQSAETAQDNINHIVPEIARTERAEANYTKEGSLRQAEKAQWQKDAEEAAESAALAVQASDFETALQSITDTLNALRSSDNTYSEASLERSIQLTQDMRLLADAIRDSDYLNAATARYDEAAANYEAKLDAQVQAQIAVNKAERDFENAETPEQQAACEAALANARSLLTAAEADTAAAREQAELREAEIAQAEQLMYQARESSLEANQLGYTLSNVNLDPDARALNVQIDQIIEGGEISIHNEGDISVTVDGGVPASEAMDMKLGAVHSERGDVSIANASGSILAAANADQTENIHGSNITLNSRDAIGDASSSLVVEGVTHATERMTSAYVISLADDEGTTAFGGLVKEHTAQRYNEPNKPIGSLYDDGTYTDIEVRMIDEKGSPIAWNDAASVVALRQDVLRVCDYTEGTALNVTAGNGGVYLTEKTGDIGASQIIVAQGDVVLNVPTGQIAAKDERAVVNVGGEMTVNAQGEVNLIAQGDLVLNLNTEANHVEISTENGIAGSITVVSESTDTLIGSALSNGSVSLTNGGDIGTEDSSFEIATDPNSNGTVSLNGKNIYVNNAAGDIIVDTIVARGSLKLTVAGSVLDSGNTGLGDAIDPVVEAQKTLTEAERELTERERALEQYTDKAGDVIQAKTVANNALAEAQTEKTRADQTLTDAENALQQAEDNYEAAVSAHGELSEEALEAGRQLEQARANVQEAGQAAEAAAQNLEEAQRAADEAAADPLIVMQLAEETLRDAMRTGADNETIQALNEALDEGIESYREHLADKGDPSTQQKIAEAEELRAENALTSANKAAQELTDAQEAADKAAEAVTKANADVEAAQNALDEAPEEGKAAAQAALEAARPSA